MAENLFACNELRGGKYCGWRTCDAKRRMNIVTLVVRMRHDACACVRFLRRHCFFFFSFFVLSCVLFFV